MPYVTSDMTAAMRTNVKAIFMQALGDLAAGFNYWQKIATVMPSDSDKEEYNWLGASPPMSEWVDKRRLQGLRPFSYTLTNQDWEATLEINRNAFNDNKLGHIPSRMRGLTRSYLKRILEEVFSKLDYAATGTAYDGTAMCADTRTIGDSGNIDNLLSGAYSGSEAEIRTALALAYTNMANFKDDWGKPLGLIPDLIVCSPAMFILITQALWVPGVAGTVRPEAKYVKDIVVSPWIDADVDDWYVLCTTEEIKPIIFQDRQKPEVTSLDKPDDRDVFMAKTLYYGIDARFTVGYGDPRTLIKVVDV